MASEFVRKVKGIRNIDILSPNITTENDLISTIDGEVYVATNRGYRKITGVETKEIKKIKTDLSNLKIQSDTNTLTISDNTDELETNTSEIETLKTSTDNNTSEIGTLKTSTGNNTSEIETLKTTTDNNTSEIATLKTSTSNNETNIDSTQTLIGQLQTQIDDLKANTKQYYTLFNGSVRGVGGIIPLNDDYTTYDILYITLEFPGGVFTEVTMVKEIIDNISVQRPNLRDTDGTFLGTYEIKLTPNSNTELEIANDVSWDELGSTGTGQDRNAYTILNIEGVK